MAMSDCERKRKQRSTPAGYMKSRECEWRQQGIKNASYLEYLEMIADQHGQCAVCHTEIDSSSPLDHNHSTGMVRGVLCMTCNFIVGQVEAQRRETINAVMAYLLERKN